MSYKSRTQLTKEIELPSGAKVTIQSWRKGATDALRNIMLNGGKQESTLSVEDDAEEVKTATVSQRINTGAYTTAVILHGVAVNPATGVPLWDLDDEDGSILPLNKHTVEEILNEPDSDFLVKAIKMLNRGADKSGTGQSEPHPLHLANTRPKTAARA